MNNHLVVCDDGSTSCKLTTEIDGEIISIISPNRAEIGKGISFGKQPFVYKISDDDDSQSAFLTFSEQKNALPTSNKSYQFHPQSRASVHHALNQAGIANGKIDLVVTLPINQYFNADGSVNDGNIEKKKHTHMGFIQSVNHKTYSIETVHVYPEGIPAIYMYLQKYELKSTEISMLLDIGGTTTDAVIFIGNAAELIRIDSFSVGTFEIMESIRSELTNTLSNVFTMHLDLILKHFEDPDFIKENLNVEVDINKHLSPVFERLLIELHEFNKGEINNTNIYITGGGAKLLSHYLNKKGIKNTTLERHETALSEAIYMLETSQYE
ncbi:hypothetical protein ABT56_19130 [Photobacterium aquae]|uniref:Uncharacterized protein n=1 Tax=Photobacterium aquae TaxID=1195763 RepID=A0A0J1GUX5_9GAMM|nr:plasmid segregation protein ParM domain-containing protein [Photobacterium aquae]KLV03543.1 hypothetical protein ABT56_19130 [Photobacterium aquae]